MPKVTRREFLKVGGAAAAGAVVGSRKAAKAMELDRGGASYNYARTAYRREAYYSISPFGKLKSPVEVYVENEEAVVGVAGHPGHPATRGRSTAVDVVSHLFHTDPDRIVTPMKRVGKRGEDRWKRISWEEALGEIASRVAGALDAGGADSLWLLRGEDSGDGLWTRFMHTLGSSSIVAMEGDKNKKAGQSFTWGEEQETPDFANAKYILNFGANIYETFPAYAQAVVDGRMEGHAKLVTIDPRMSMTAGLSDEWVPIIPGTDGLVALAMAKVIFDEGLADLAFINKWTNYPADKLAKHLSQYTPELAEEISGVPADRIRRLAVEFATAGPATIFTYRGVSSHTNGLYNERACMLLPVITGNVEVKGGYCLPRRFSWNAVEPVPPVPAGKGASAGFSFPYAVSGGKVSVRVLFSYSTNPAFSAPAAAFWRDVLKDEALVPFSVAVTHFMTETAALADIILPDAMYLEKNEPVTSPSSLFPWVGVRTPVAESPGEVKELSVTLRDIVQAVDKDGSRGFKKFWSFDDPTEWMGKYFEKVQELKEEGGYDAIAENAVWPSYGELDTATGKMVNDEGKPLEARYGLHETKGFKTRSGKIEIYSEELAKRGLHALPVWLKPENLVDTNGEGLAFITFKTAYQAGSSTSNNKYLAEKEHSNPCWINKETAAERGIEDGALIRIESPVGYMVTKARVTNAVHPKVVAVAASFGHRAVGRVAAVEPHSRPGWVSGEDADIHYNLWWRDGGVNPNDIIPFFVDPAGGGAAMAFTVKVTPAKPGDSYGDIKVDLNSHRLFFERASAKIKV